EAHKLTLARIQKIVRDRVPKLYGDGLGLWLQVSRQGHVSWLYRFTPKGKRPRAMGLGSLREVGLAEARRKAREAREQLTKGVDPLDRPKIAKSFKQAYDEFLKTWPKRVGWKTRLETYAFPFIGEMPVDQITTQHVRDMLAPIWSQKTRTADRTRRYVRAILDFAETMEWRAGKNPAQWRGGVDPAV